RKGHFTRGADGKIDDDELAECIADAIEDPAGSFGAQNVPPSMRAVEILGIIQGRKWNLAGLNEFRKHFGLKPYETFEDINSDPGVSEALRRLYDHPDFVELYPGIVAEEHKSPMVPGVGIAPTYTISRVVLSDAVCLVRGDRHHTIDYNPRNLTNWGYARRLSSSFRFRRGTQSTRSNNSVHSKEETTYPIEENRGFYHCTNLAMTGQSRVNPVASHRHLQKESQEME
ncbi:hypothetical protein N0V85_009885, partial [Neurospora sp. IMI 360204]